MFLQFFSTKHLRGVYLLGGLLGALFFIGAYNLFPYFEKFGFFRTVFMEINDYGNKYVAQTKDMVEEFRADMEALGLKTCTDEMIETIAHSNIPRYSVPNFPNTPIAKK